MTRWRLLAVLVVLAGATVFVPPVAGSDTPPDAPAGYVGPATTAAGEPLADGTTIEMIVNDSHYGTTTVHNGSYETYIRADAGQTVVFQVDGEPSATAPLTAGTHTVPIEVPTTPDDEPSTPTKGPSTGPPKETDTDPSTTPPSGDRDHTTTPPDNRTSSTTDTQTSPSTVNTTNTTVLPERITTTASRTASTDPWFNGPTRQSIAAFEAPFHVRQVTVAGVVTAPLFVVEHDEVPPVMAAPPGQPRFGATVVTNRTIEQPTELTIAPPVETDGGPYQAFYHTVRPGMTLNESHAWESITMTTNASAWTLELPQPGMLVITETPKPTAQIGAPETVTAGETIVVSGEDSTVTAGTIETYRWTIANRSYRGPTPVVTLTQPGTHQLTLTVTTAANQTATTRTQLTVTQDSDESLVPVPGFSAISALLAVLLGGYYRLKGR